MVQSQVGELRSCKLGGMAKKQNKTKNPQLKLITISCNYTRSYIKDKVKKKLSGGGILQKSSGQGSGFDPWLGNITCYVM